MLLLLLNLQCLFLFTKVIFPARGSKLFEVQNFILHAAEYFGRNKNTMENMDTEENEIHTHTIQARFVSDAGEEAGPPIDLPITVDLPQLELICNALLKNVSYN